MQCPYVQQSLTQHDSYKAQNTPAKMSYFNKMQGIVVIPESTTNLMRLPAAYCCLVRTAHTIPSLPANRKHLLSANTLSTFCGIMHTNMVLMIVIVTPQFSWPSISPSLSRLSYFVSWRGGSPRNRSRCL